MLQRTVRAAGSTNLTRLFAPLRLRRREVETACSTQSPAPQSTQMATAAVDMAWVAHS
jgi:hypothetical protein